MKYKAEYKAITGSDYQPAGGASNRKDKKKENKPPKDDKKQQSKEKKAAASTPTDDGQKQKQTRLGVEFKKSEALSDWYSQVRLCCQISFSLNLLYCRKNFYFVLMNTNAH